MKVIDKDSEHTGEFKCHIKPPWVFLWEKVEINQDLIDVNSILKGITRTEVIYVTVKYKETLYDL